MESSPQVFRRSMNACIMFSTSDFRSVTKCDGFDGRHMKDLGLACSSSFKTAICSRSCRSSSVLKLLTLLTFCSFSVSRRRAVKTSKTSFTLTWKSFSGILAWERCAKTSFRKTRRSSTLTATAGLKQGPSESENRIEKKKQEQSHSFVSPFCITLRNLLFLLRLFGDSILKKSCPFLIESCHGPSLHPYTLSHSCLNTDCRPSRMMLAVM